MSGIQLGSLDACDMVDAIHYLFEQEHEYTSEDHRKQKLTVREHLYRDLYDREVAVQYKEQQSNTSLITPEVPKDFDYGARLKDRIQSDIGSDIPFDPKKNQPKPPPKPRIAPTKFNPDAARPFGMLLDPPLN